MPYTMTTCPFCGCGCGLYLQGDGTKLSGVAASPAHPVGQGRLCLKGWHAHDIAASPERLRAPLIRRGERLQEASWKEALDLVAARLGEIRAQGPEAVGLFASARATNEENFLLSKLARGTLGTNNVDFCARLEALPQFFDLAQYRHLTSPTATLGDIARADLIVLWQADVAQEHPAAAARVLRAARDGATVIEVGVRSGQAGMAAGLRLHPLPGTEARLAAGLLNVALAARAALRREAKALAASVDGSTPERTEAITGVPAEQVRAAGTALAAAARPLILYSRALTCSAGGADVLVSLSAFHHLANGDTHRPGLLWLNRQSNFHGARDMGVVPYFLSGHQAVSDAGVRRKFEQAWGNALPAEPGLPAWEMLGAVRGLFVLSDDPLQSLPDPARARQALAELDFLAVMDLYLSPTAQLADVVLPGASFAEKDGTVTNVEGRVQRVRQAVPPPGEARAEWEVLGDLSARLGRSMDYASPAAIMEEIALLTPCYSHVSYGGLETDAEVRCERWELTPEEAASLVAGDVEADMGPPGEAAPTASGELPMMLMVDYALGEWAEDAAVVCSAALRRELGRNGRAGLTVAINPEDAERCGVQEGQRVRLGSGAGETEAQVHLDASVRAGVLTVSFRAREAAAPVLAVTTDGETGVPVLAPCAVTIRKQ